MFSKVEISNNLKDNVKVIADSIVKNIKNETLIEVSNNRAILLSEEDCLRAISKMSVDNSKRILWEMISREAYKCEQASPFSSFLFLCELAEKEIEKKVSKKMTAEALSEICRDLLGENLGKAFFDAISISGPNAIIQVEETSGQTFIKMNDCIEIAASIPGEFGEKIELRDVNFFTFDGVIEKVADINRLLEDLSQKDEAGILLARGFGYEVVSTLLYNWRTKKLKVIPASISGDLLDNFLFIDIPNVLGGNRIGLDDIWKERAGCIDQIEIEKGKIIINDAKLSRSSNAISKKIIDDSPQDPSSKEWASMRARRISSRKIVISLGREFGGLKGLVKDRIQLLVRFILFSRKHGISIVNLMGKDIIIPSHSLCEAKKSANSFVEIINNTKVTVSYDK